MKRIQRLWAIVRLDDDEIHFGDDALISKSKRLLVREHGIFSDERAVQIEVSIVTTKKRKARRKP